MLRGGHTSEYGMYARCWRKLRERRECRMVALNVLECGARMEQRKREGSYKRGVKNARGGAPLVVASTI